MIQQKRGAIVNIASAAVKFGGFGGDSNYLASKGGVAAFTKATAVEMAQKGIRVKRRRPWRHRDGHDRQPASQGGRTPLGHNPDATVRRARGSCPPRSSSFSPPTRPATSPVRPST